MALAGNTLRRLEVSTAVVEVRSAEVLEWRV